MKTNEFISILRAAPSNQLIFADLDGRAVHSGYHLTEYTYMDKRICVNGISFYNLARV